MGVDDTRLAAARALGASMLNTTAQALPAGLAERFGQVVALAGQGASKVLVDLR